MSFTVQDVEIQDTRVYTVTITVADGPVVKKPYGQRSYRLTEVRLSYRKSNNEPWDVNSVHFFGPFVKKDGTDAVNSTSESIWGSERAKYDWLLDMIDRYMPSEQ